MFAALAGAASLAATTRQPTAPPTCTPSGPLVRVPELPEASGVAASRQTPGRFWSHNDSGQPVLFVLDSTGAVTGRLRLSGATVEDWEAVAVGPCPAGSCIYVADIGDNDARRARVTVYRLAEPAAATESAKVSDVLHATYPDGPQDAEALLVLPDGRLYIVTKGATGPVVVYRFPSDPRDGSTSRLERVGAPREPNPGGKIDRVTDGSVSPDGQWVVLRSTQALTFYRTADLLAGEWRVGRPCRARLDRRAAGRRRNVRA